MPNPRPRMAPQLRAMMPRTPLLMSAQQKLDFTEMMFSKWADMTGMGDWHVTTQRTDTTLTITIEVPE